MINIGVVGSGGIIAKHIGHLADRTDARIVALCDVNPEMIQARQEAFFEDRQVNGYATPEEMYANEQLDAVIITTPHTLHYGQAVQALEAGCHVFLEKPMTTSSKDAIQLAAKAEEREKVVAVGYNTASKPTFQYLREQIRNQTWGSLEMVSGFLSQNWMTLTTGLWRQDPALSGGGQAYDSGAHILNSLLWSVESEPETVFAFTDNKSCAVDINSVMSIRFANGVLGNITISGNCAADGRHMAFIFEKALVEIDGWGGDWIKVHANGKAEEPEIDIHEVFPINNFVEAVQGKAQVAASTKNGINHSLLMDGIYASAQSGLPVHPAELQG
jgi:predicted dehydrogenase